VAQRIRERRRKNKEGLYFDYSLLFIVIFLVSFGLIMLYSASSFEAQVKFGHSSYYLKKQLLCTGIGSAFLIILTLIDYRFWRLLRIPIYIVGLCLIFLVRTPLGITANGATRWVSLPGGFSFQPSEVAKVAVIIFFSDAICRLGKSIQKPSSLVKLTIYGMPFLLAIMFLTDNMSTTIILAGIIFVMIFVATPQYGRFVVLGLGVLAAAGGMIYAISAELIPSEISFRLVRIQTWLNPEAYAQEGGFQTMQALYAIGSGGVFGKGLGKSIQKIDFLPEAQNDMIFSVICEELGVVGGIAVILLFLLLLWRFMIIANNAPDLFGSMLVVGVMSHIALQVVFNIAVVTNTIPNTGITLPFISYGGTSVIFLMAEMGLVLSVSKRIRLED